MARTVTLLQLRTDISNQADVVVGSGSTDRYTPTFLNRLINQSIQRFRERLSTEGSQHYLVPTSGNLTAGATPPYPFGILDLTAASPGIVRVYGIDVTVSQVTQTLLHIPFQDRAAYGSTSQTGIPKAWASIKDGQVAILPSPQAGYPYTVWYLPVAADLSADGDTFDGVAGWEDYITWDVVCRLIVRDQYQDAYALAVQYRNEIWQDILRTATKVSLAGGATVARDTFGARASAMPMARQMGNGYGSTVGGGPVTPQGLPGALQYNQAGLMGGTEILVGQDAKSFNFPVRALQPTGQVALSSPTGSTLAIGFAGVDKIFFTPTGITAPSITATSISASQIIAPGLGFPTGLGDKLGAWTASGLASQATGIYVSGSGLSLSFGNKAAGTGILRFEAGAKVYASTDAGIPLRVLEMRDDLSIGDGLNNSTLYSDTKAGGFFTWRNQFANKMVLSNAGLTIASGIDFQSAKLAFPTGIGDKLGVWTTGGYASQATGIRIGGSGTNIAFGANPSTGGSIRLSNTQSIRTNKADGSADIVIASVQGDNVVQLGDITNAAEVDINSSGPIDFNFPGANNPTHRMSLGGLFMGSGTNINMGINGAILFGSGVASNQGLTRFPHNSDIIYARDKANATNVPIVRWGQAVDNMIILGGGAEGVARIQYETTSGEHKFRIATIDKVQVNSDNLRLEQGIRLGVVSHAFPTGLGDKLGGWTPSGFANIATGIYIVGSGTRLSFGNVSIPSGIINLGEGLGAQSINAMDNLGGSIEMMRYRRDPLVGGRVLLGSTAPVVTDIIAGSDITFQTSNGVFLSTVVGANRFVFSPNSPSGYNIENVGAFIGADGYKRVVDWNEPLRGSPLTDADATKSVNIGNRYLMPSGVLSTGRTITLIPTGATVGEILTIERLDNSANTLTVVRGGLGGSGTIYTFPNSQKRSADFVFASATSWALSGHVRLT